VNVTSVDDEVTDSRAVARNAYTSEGTLFLPALTLLGIVLPFTFFAWIDRYLYYLRPVELVPTYGTAWLLLSVPALLVTAVGALVVHVLARYQLLRARRALRFLLLWVCWGAAIATVGFCSVAWLRSFGLLGLMQVRLELSSATGLVGVSMSLALPLVAWHKTRRAIERLKPTAVCFTLIGALSALSLPFFGWSSDATSAPPPPPVVLAPSSHPKPHILLVTIDALAAEHMSTYGAARRTTPYIDALAGGAMVFDRAYANANFTTPGVSSILTGTRPWTHRALQLPTWPLRSVREKSLPAVLQEVGYQTGYVATNPVAGATKNGLRQYFSFAASDRVPAPLGCHDQLSEILRYHCAVSQLAPIVFIEWLREKTLGAISSRDNDQWHPAEATSAALNWLNHVNKQQPVFLWLHLLPPHAPYAAPKPWLGRFSASSIGRRSSDSELAGQYLMRGSALTRVQALEARYDEAVQYVDYSVGAFLASALRILGPDTVVVISADHGESFAHGYGSHGGPALYDSIIHIPLIIKLPFETRPFRTAALAQQIDIAPTLAALAGVVPPSSWEGRSLLAAWDAADDGQAAVAPETVFSMNFEQNRRFARLSTGSVAVLEGHWKLVHYMGPIRYPLMPPLHDELYDLSSDPRELHNLAAANPAEVTHLRSLIDAQLALHGGPVQ